ncbi:hypothetical protein BJ508DRAFT_334600 [Ascobolus immersus RN42]|uniref:Uncharacterized protein n=1 Tax=Ascobolus immersus RN42 TaxID=1160509 RepID=A0A3N4HIV9_ASCIM|nr:hypothetical protein BJ508DRAFT_334600 [Ascobolus immersus RN42]
MDPSSKVLASSTIVTSQKGLKTTIADKLIKFTGLIESSSQSQPPPESPNPKGPITTTANTSTSTSGGDTAVVDLPSSPKARKRREKAQARSIEIIDLSGSDEESKGATRQISAEVSTSLLTPQAGPLSALVYEARSFSKWKTGNICHMDFPEPWMKVIEIIQRGTLVKEPKGKGRDTRVDSNLGPEILPINDAALRLMMDEFMDSCRAEIVRAAMVGVMEWPMQWQQVQMIMEMNGYVGMEEAKNDDLEAHLQEEVNKENGTESKGLPHDDDERELFEELFGSDSD